MVAVNENDAFYECATVRDIDVPADAYIGLSAATGGLVDNHDILTLKTLAYPSHGSPRQHEQKQDSNGDRHTEEVRDVWNRAQREEQHEDEDDFDETVLVEGVDRVYEALEETRHHADTRFDEVMTDVQMVLTQVISAARRRLTA